MKRLIFLFLLLPLPFQGFSQELLAEVTINYQKVQGSNNQVFETLKKALKDYINNTSWTSTGNAIPVQERIKCAFVIVVTEKASSSGYKATLLVQASRPVYNSTYLTPILNYQDSDFSFDYTENERLTYDGRRFSGKNLIDVISYYIFMILGYDADTFSPKGGDSYFTQTQKIADYSINQGYSGWNSFDGPKTRGSLIANIISDKSNTLRQIAYQYHRQGLDVMATSDLKGKTAIGNSLLKLNAYSDSFQYYPLDIFLTAKKDEIANIFSSGPAANVNITELKTLLQRISPINSDIWNKIKN
ncbi:MAG: DUF4835 family protein [Flavobacteriaceae bacterium]|jgi:hypothetical protein|nr:DUF4835 family protein [Flavobacteriaceae bacterium]